MVIIWIMGPGSGMWRNLQKKSISREHPDGALYLPEKTLAIHIFACVETDAYDERIYHSGKDEDISQLLSHIRDKAVQYREAERGEA